jgi:dTDP-4-dehydrorhamnose 3,5-epimerase
VRAEDTSIPGCTLLHLDRHEDERGDFVKALQRDTYEQLGLDPSVAELFWSTSRRGVVRGLHFQTPPHAHAKTVTVVRGEVLDVVVDLRVGSPTYGRHCSWSLSDRAPAAVHIPVGCAHGFAVTSAEAIVLYLVGTEHSPEHDEGVRWDSVGADWPTTDPIISARDAGFPALADFDSPFRFGQQAP